MSVLLEYNIIILTLKNEDKKMNNYTPRIYVACLSSHNNGFTHGVWIEDIQDIEDIQEEIKEMLSKSKFECAEEWEIHDYEDFGSIEADKLSLSEICFFAEAIEEHGELFTETYPVMGSFESTLSMIENNFLGIYESVVEYVEETTDLSEVPDYLVNYIDINRLARDIEYDLLVVELEHEVAIFHN